VRVFGHDPEDGERALRERVGIVLQESGAQAELTVAEVLTMYGRYYPRRRPVSQLVELVGLAGKEGRRVKLLSGGQRRRPRSPSHCLAASAWATCRRSAARASTRRLPAACSS
jgi:ABC-type multidrug transport system ATPase subunit